MTRSRFLGNWVFMFLPHLCMLCASPVVAQNPTLDSLNRLVSLAKQDTLKVSLLISLSKAYRGIDGQRAIECATFALDLAKELNSIRWIALSEHRLGTAYRSKRDFENSIAHLHNAEIAYRGSGDLIHAAEMPIDVGLCLASLGNIEPALDTMTYSRRLYTQLLSSPDSATRHVARVGVTWSYYFAFSSLYQANQLRRALEYLTKLETVTLEFGLIGQLPNLYNSFGATYLDLGNLDKALQYYAKALKMAEESNGWDDQQRLLDNISRIHVQQGEYNKGRELLQKAVSILLTHLPERVDYLARLHASLAEVHAKLARYDDALENYLKALRFLDQGGSVHDAAKLKNEMGSFFFLQADYVQAIEYLQQARKLYEQENNSAGVSNVLFELGRISSERDNDEDALAYHRQALNIRKQNGEKFSVALSTCELGRVFLTIAEGKLRNQSVSKVPHDAIVPSLDSATVYFASAAEMSRSLSDENTEVKCLQGLGRIEALRSHWTESLDYYDRAVQLSDSLGMRRELYESYAAMASVSEKLGRYNDAYNYQRLSATMKDSVFNESSSRQMKEMQAKYESERKDRDIDILGRQNEIATLKVKDQQSALRQAQLEAGKRESDVRLLSQTQELQQQQIINANRTLAEKELEAKAKSAELEAAHKEQLLQEHNLQEQRLIMYGTIAFAILTIVLGILLFSRFRLRKELDKRNAILEERRRISSDMHDDLGSSLSTIALLSQVMRQNARGTDRPSEAEKISVAAQQSLEKMSEIVWSLNPRNDKLENLVAYIRKYTMEYLDDSPVKCSVTMSGAVPDVEITGEQRRNVFLTVKEALHNIVKHSQATCAELAFEFQDHTLQLSIHDDGKGIDTATQSMFGNGIINMQRRMKEAGGVLAIGNKNGTTVRLMLPIREGSAVRKPPNRQGRQG
jgi:two-component system, NarL family, sensor histidine kinase UhpB